ncbi:MAG: hypothetical protein Phog2KO_09820 [Phototrophicaceae bacterium]
MKRLLKQRLEALYIHNRNNRLLAVNEPDTNQETPYLAIMRSEENLLWRVHHDVSDDIVTVLDKLLLSETPTANFTSPLKYRNDYLDILGQHAPIKRVQSGPAYILPESQTTQKTVLITEDNTEVLAAHFSYTLEIFNFRSPITAMVINDTAVAVCFCARKTEHVAEAGVFTLEAYRKRGFAKLVVNDWAVAIHQENLVPIYSTSYSNIASQSVANTLGARQFATDFGFY